MAIPSRPQKNIWVAAGDGDLDRVQVSMSPNAPDPNTYTPMHAAASYGHIDVLEYLISHGGDVNITDSDGDTPLYTVETIETAQYLLDKGAVLDRVNDEGVSPIAHLSEDYPQVSAYLQSRSSLPPPAPYNSNVDATASQYAQNAASEQLTALLLSSIQDLVDQGVDPETVDAELRRRVEEAVLNGLLDGYALGTQIDINSGEQEETPSGAHTRAPMDEEGSENKRPRTED
ncbi:ankyrin repeat-containing domain protein [Rhodocollybia butyracea]|uniref:Ankyrin repeat-containing domain protein n=1 Tax=Rhodocollybia butyracea TaxID=206335 RepID=A0A9P5U7Y0_9AGAR|nr:ankyrin repeat-containing domain protein [Rhodocollybia butyracea]